jgi:hypothetical protein
MFIFRGNKDNKVVSLKERKKGNIPTELKDKAVELWDSGEVEKNQRGLFDIMGEVNATKLKPNWINILLGSGDFFTECDVPLGGKDDIERFLIWEGVVKFTPHQEGTGEEIIKGVISCGHG